LNALRIVPTRERINTSSGAYQDGGPPRVLLVGAGTRFLSAMSYYTIRLGNALAGRFAIAVIPMRQLLPTFMYPGRSRVGSIITRLEYVPAVKVLNDIDWYWVPSFFLTLKSLRKWRPDVVIFEWWTGTVLHTYLAIALLARLRGASVIVEFHEVLDSSEERIPLARMWVRALGRPFFQLASGFVIHSNADREPLEKRYRLGSRPCVLIYHGPFDHHVSKQPDGSSAPDFRRTAPPGTLNLLYFGIIRPYKGLEDLVQAFGSLDDEEVNRYWLTVVGETWEGWDLPVRRIQSSRHHARITLVNRFVDDDEVGAYFASADAVVLPYRRSSASGPAHVAMSHGLPLVVTAVGGLPAAVADYKGAVLVPPRDPTALRDAIRRLPDLCGRHYKDPHSWDRTVTRYEELMEQLSSRATRGRDECDPLRHRRGGRTR
jgi:glycosyltransferase involved in cell wall biosynthesis